MEREMLKYLPIVLLVALPAAYAAADRVPTLDMKRECNFEGSVLGNQQQCLADEEQAKQQLQQEWPQFNASDKRQCLSEATMAGAASYVELITCLEMARDTRNSRAASGKPQK